MSEQPTSQDVAELLAKEILGHINPTAANTFAMTVLDSPKNPSSLLTVFLGTLIDNSDGEDE